MKECIIDSKQDLSLYIWGWFTEGRYHEPTETQVEMERYVDAPHWSNFVGLITDVILSGEDLPFKEPTQPIIPTPSFEEDWTLFFNTVDLHAIADQIIRREMVQMIKYLFNYPFNNKQTESRWLCRCAGCRNFMIARISGQ